MPRPILIPDDDETRLAMDMVTGSEKWDYAFHHLEEAIADEADEDYGLDLGTVEGQWELVLNRVETLIDEERRNLDQLREKMLGAKERPTSKKVGGRVAITDEIQEKVRALSKQGKTASEIGKELGIAIPTVQNIKRRL